MHRDISRRAILAGGTALLAAAQAEQQAQRKLKVAIFSKHLQFLEGEELPKGAADIGFDCVDITVRRGGHVEPERVRQDLPPLAAIIRRHGIEVPMITTDIVDAETPLAEDVLKTMAQLEIRNYRWGGFRYAADRPYALQLDQMRARIAKLAALNARYHACAIYHTHSGVGQVGASIWDLYILLKDLDPNHVAVNYDVAHATIEGGLGGWINSFQIIRPYLRGIAVKDFAWGKDAKGTWQAQWKPVGEGMVRFRQFFAMVANSNFSGPVQVHFEYPLGGANEGTKTITISREEVFGAMKRDLGRIRGYLAAAKL
jgi:sugar phosphate isomerase/epimerase